MPLGVEGAKLKHSIHNCKYQGLEAPLRAFSFLGESPSQENNAAKFQIRITLSRHRHRAILTKAKPMSQAATGKT
jgi:hypothetical protein